MPSNKVSNYMKNMAKSFGYALGDVFTEYNPVIYELASETKQNTKDLYERIKDFHSDLKNNPDKDAFKNQAKDAVNNIWNNVKEDVKSGNWYNKTRKDNSNTLMIDDDIGFDIDFDDWGDFDDDPSTDTAISVASEEKSTAKIISSMDIVGSNIANSISAATVESANYIAISASKSSKAIYDVTTKGFSSVTSALLSINNSVSSFAQIGEPLTTHMQNSSLFYTNATKHLEQMSRTLETIAKNTTPIPAGGGKKRRGVKNSFSDVMGYGFSINAYRDMIMSNFGNNNFLREMGLDAISGARRQGSNLGKDISLMEYFTKFITKSIIPGVLKESMKSLNETIKYSLSGSVIKLRNHNSSNLLVELLKDFILPKDAYKIGTNTSNYEKGAIPWDGIAKQALTRVIPTILLNIYSAITGKEEQTYNYETGKFVTIRSAKKKSEEEKEKYAKNAGGDFRKSILNNIKNNNKLSDDERKRLEQEIESYFFKAFTSGSDFYNVNKSDFDYKKFGLSPESLEIIRSEIESNRKSKDSKKRNNHLRYIHDNQYYRDSYGENKRRQEATGTSIEAIINDNFLRNKDEKKNELEKVNLDEYENPISFYLQGIYQYTGYLADNIQYISGRGGKIRKRKSLSKSKNKIDEIKTPTTSSQLTGNQSSGNTSSDDNIEEFLTEEQIEDQKREERGKEIRKKVKGIKEWFKKLFGKDSNSESFVSKLYNRPFELVAGFLDKVGLSLDKLIWGDDNKPENGILGRLFKKFDKVEEWIEDKLKIKERFNKFKEWIYSGGIGELRDETIANLKNAGSWAGNTIKTLFVGKGKENRFAKFKKPKVDGGAAYGRKVTKSGIVAVSEGELIIPSELNPFYHGHTDKRKQVRTEQRAIRNFYGAFAPGGVPGDEEGTREFHEAINPFAVAREKYPEMMEEVSKLSKEVPKKVYSVLGSLMEGISELGSGIKKFVSNAEDDKNEQTKEEDKKITNAVKDFIFKEMGDNKGAMAAGAIIGTGVSILSGAMIGPVLGAAVGAGTGLIVNSNKVQTVLFGRVIDEETGEVEGGLLSKGVANFMKNSMPEIAKGATIGGLGGLLVGSPVLGAFLGGGLNFVRTSEKVQEYIFGSVDKYKEVEKKIYDKSTAGTIGAIAGLAIGPFGLLPNIVIGAGMGILASSEGFQKYMFGEDGKSGLAGDFRDKIFGNLDDIFHNIGNAVRGWGKSLIKNTGDRIKDFFTNRIERYENGERGLLTTLIGGTGALAGGLVKGATNLVGNTLGKVAGKIRQGNLKRGYGVYDRTKKRNMLAGERVEARKFGNRHGTFNNLDQMIAKAGSKEELEELRNNLEDARDPSRIFKRTSNKIISKLYKDLEGLDSKKTEKIVSIVEKSAGNDPDKVIKKIEKILDQSEYNAYGEVIKDALNSLRGAKGSNEASKSILRNFASKGIHLNKSKVNRALDQVNYELKNNEKFSPEELEKKNTENFRSRLKKALENIDINIAKMTGGKTVDGKEPPEAEVKRDEDIAKEEQEQTSIRDILDKMNQDKGYVVDSFGNIYKTEEDEHGDVSIVTNDRQTDESQRKSNKIMEAINHLNKLPVIGGILGGIGGLFGKMHEKLFGDGKEKKGILGSLLGFLGGEDGPLSWLTSLFTGNPIVSAIKTGLSGITLKSVLTNVAMPALVAYLLSGKADDLFHRISGGSFGKGGDSNVYYDKNTGERLSKDENGNIIDSEGNIVNGTDVGVRQGDVASVSERIWENTARGVVTGRRSLVSTTLGRTRIGKSVSSAVGSVTSSMGTSAAAAAARSGLISNITEACAKFATKLRGVPKLAPIADKLEAMGAELAEKIGAKLASESAEKLANLAATAVAWAKLILLVVDFTTGYEDARTTLGITAEPTVPQRIMSGLLRAIKNLIPIIGSIIPDSLVVDVFCKYIAPTFGIDASELMRQREEAEEDVQAYNSAHGTNYTLEQYNKTVLEDYTWTERSWNQVKNTWQDTKSRFSNMVNGTKEMGFTGYWKNYFSNMGADYMNAYNEAGGGISGFFSGLGKAWKDILPGTIGEIMDKNHEVWSLAFKGKLGEMWDVTLDEFDGGKVNEDGIETAAPTMISKVIGQVPLFISKVLGTVPALVLTFGNWLADKMDPYMDANIENNNAYNRALESIKTLSKDGDTDAVWNFKVEFNEKDPVKFIWDAGITISKMFQSIISLFYKLSNWTNEKMEELKANPVVQTVGGWFGAFDDEGDGPHRSGGGDSSGRHSGAGSGIESDFVSQLDPKYSGMKYADSTVGEKGCAPAVASMIAKGYGINLGMEDAIKASRSYQNSDGTSINYFDNVLGSKGITTKSFKGSNMRKEMGASLLQGNQVILLGNDPKNRSKNNSPFGPNNHYVVAKGIDRNGNIIINDPESPDGTRSYDASILNSVKMGVGTAPFSASGANGYDTETARYVWDYFINKGYSPAATAGIMGNMYTESGVNPEAIQAGGKGPAAGIVQWLNYNKNTDRFKVMSDYANSLGKDWKDLDAQLNFIDAELMGDTSIPGLSVYTSNLIKNQLGSPQAFKDLTDVRHATELFTKKFERPAPENQTDAAIDGRYAHSSKFYELYTDPDYSPPNIATITTDENGNRQITTKNGTVTSINHQPQYINESEYTDEDDSGGNILQKLMNIFGKIADIFNFDNLFGNNSTYSSSTSSSTPKSVTEGRHISHDDLIGLPGIASSDIQQALVDKMRSIEGTISYSMNGPRDPDKGSADCSSTVNWAYKSVTGTDVGNNTLAMFNNENTEVVDQASNMDPTTGGSNSSGPDLNKIQPGDILLYSRPDGGYTAGRPYRVGHVEMYMGDNSRIGHGSGMGPKITEISKDQNHYIMAKRLKGITSQEDDEYIPTFEQLNRSPLIYPLLDLETKSAENVSNNKINSIRTYESMAASGGSSGILLKNRPGSRLYKKSTTNASVPKTTNMRKYSGGASMVSETRNMLNNLKSDVSYKAKSGSISTELVEKLLESIIAILQTISNNTQSVQQIYDVLIKYLGGKSTSTQSSSNGSKSSSGGEVDNNIRDLASALAAIAKG